MSVEALRRAEPSVPVSARAILLLVALLWGLNYIATNFGLRAFSPWAFRTLSFLGAAVLLVLLAPMIRANLQVASLRDNVHLFVSGTFACGGFGVLSAISILHTSTGRSAICAYTMPIWVALLGRIFLKEKMTPDKIAALSLCCLGLLVLLWPLLMAGVSFGALAAIGSAICWAIGIVYLKWAQVAAHPLAVAVRQLLAGALASAIGMAFTGWGVSSPVRSLPILGLAYGIIIGTAVSYPLWFNVLERLPATIAGLGTLLVPVFGVIASALILGERPTPADMTGFALILLAAVIALKPPSQRNAA